ncbi:beta-ketoacyl-[acyl-carrier-protein] synthase family protein [Piscinibacter sakaiensis]|uniref:beta-ketoacyl-[acyl-carrier-protein] synthase family protein n=1 Tax=Piscinibacter sakaiensis TaxID=1547922 RepID=UPI003AAC777F
MKRLPVSDFTIACATGVGRAACAAALREGRSGLQQRRFETAELDTWLGIVDAVDEQQLPQPLADFDCRNNRLAWLALQADGFADRVAAAVGRYGSQRVGVFIGTSTSGILQTELAYRRRDPATGALPADFRYAQTHNPFSVADFTRRALAIDGPSAVVSTACSSSAKVFGQAARMIELGLIDAAVVGGVDSLCLTTLYGFNSLELLASDICRPWDEGRRGLSIGEGASFSLLERDSDTPAAWLLGVGESSDGHHISSPHPEGAGAIAAMRGALAHAGLEPDAVDYINLHGTATPGNDAAEDLAVHEVFGPGVPCSSTKGATGHTLGAAGAVEAALAMLALQQQTIPAGLNLRSIDPALRCNYVGSSRETRLDVVLSNSFGFGGTNASLLFGAAR